MVAKNAGHLVLFENKVDAPVDPDQLLAHRRLARENAGGREVVLVLVSRRPAVSAPVDASLTWRDVQSAMKAAAVEADPTGMILQFVEFMGMEGLGHVPGPCPTYWRASILEARRRDASQGMARGYSALGAKFVHAVLPGAIEDLAAQGDAADEHLRHALQDALESGNPERSVWRVCRMFFPSFLFREDEKLGSLRLNDRQGVAFGRGIVEALSLEGLP